MSFKQFVLPLLTVPLSISAATGESITELDPLLVTATRLDAVQKLPAAITIIDENDIKLSPAKTLPDLLAQQVGINTRSLYSHGSRATIALRNFGETASQNTLILLDGRRLNDIDLSSVNYAAIATENIKRIEITRGSGSVLYGDGATTGTINIITKSPHETKNYGVVSQTLGSFDHRKTNAFGSYSNDAFGITANINSISDDGYRDNNQFRQDTGQFDLRVPVNNSEIYLKAGAFDQDIELPGVRTVDPSIHLNELSSNRTGTSTPNDWADEYTEFATLGFTHELNSNDSFVIDGGYRRKQQRSQFDYGFGFGDYNETALKTLSLTPRLTLNRNINNHDINWIIGADLYLYQYDSKRSNFKQNIAHPVHTIAADQKSVALYTQTTISLSKQTDLTAGIRGQKLKQKARDRFDASAPGGGSGSEAAEFKESDRKTSFELGVKHHFNEKLSGYARIGRSSRFGTIDELFEFDPMFQQVFSQLKPQVSDDIELGMNFQSNRLEMSMSVFHQSLQHEIHFDPISFQNINLEDTQHDGIELAAAYKINSHLSAKANYTYLKAEFTEGNNKANDIPLIPTNSFNASLSAKLPADVLASMSFNYVGNTHFANDLANSFVKKIPSYKTVDLKLSKQIERVELALQVNNVFNEQYFNFGVNSTATQGRFNSYPLPKRTAYLTASYHFN